MKRATLTLDRDFALAPIDPRIYGGFAEHLGRHIYTGIYEPGHPTADVHGLRQDVVALVRGLRMPVMRYPGGNFVSGYHWEDGVGPRDARPRRLDLAWGITETNAFGTNEFMEWCRQVDTEPMLAVNLGTRGPAEAQALVEYCNHPGGTHWSDLRRRHGWADPHAVKLWCLGNEMDGPWQIGCKDPVEYGKVAREAAKLMKWTDPGIETVLCGSSGRGMATFGRWEWEALHEAYDQTDYLSLHTYTDDHDGDHASFFAEPENMADFIREAVALCDAVGASRKNRRKIHLSFDEWNVWFPRRGGDAPPKRTWPEVSTRPSDVYDMADVLTVGGMLLTLLENADRVKIGCIAQVVNLLAPVLTEPGGRAWRQTIYWPFQHASVFGRGTALRVGLRAPLYDSKMRERVTTLKCVAVVSEDGTALSVFAINRDPAGEPLTVALDLRAFGSVTPIERLEVAHPDLRAENTADAPDTVVPQSRALPLLEHGRGEVVLPPLSWNVLRYRVG